MKKKKADNYKPSGVFFTWNWDTSSGSFSNFGYQFTPGQSWNGKKEREVEREREREEGGKKKEKRKKEAK